MSRTTVKLSAKDYNEAITNTQINPSSAIASTNMPAGAILAIHQDFDGTAAAPAATTDDPHDILTKSFTTKKLNSTFFILWTVCHGISDEVNNMDSYDIHLMGARVTGGVMTYVGGNAGLTRNTAGSGTSQKLYCTDVPMAPSRGLTPAYGNAHDVFHRSGAFIDNPNLAAGTTLEYRVRMFNQGVMYINRGRGGTTGVGGTSSLTIMEIAA